MELLSPAFMMAALAAAIIGVAKGGFGGVGTTVTVPAMSLVMSPELALGVLLPVLMVADVISVASLWRECDWRAVVATLPGAVLGVIAGVWLLAVVDPAPIKIVIGVLSIVFAVYSLWRAMLGLLDSASVLGSDRLAPGFGFACGVTSTLAHAGGPPIHMYLLARGYSPLVFVATANVFMSLVNWMKVGPFLLIGTVTADTLRVSLKLLPVVAVFAVIGIWLAARISRGTFALMINVLMFAVGLQLLYMGVTEWIAA